MNEQIKELIVSRGLHKYISEDCQHRMEMLAKIIIDECIQVVHNQERIPEGFFYAKPAHVHELAIKQHFGIDNE